MSAPSGVTIGIPVYNEAKYVETSIRSAVEQGETVLVSDNASSDGSAEICEAMARLHPHLSLVRHEKNMGAVFNFKYVLDHATTPYFMWLGAHDLLPPGYVTSLKARLDRNSDAVLAYGAARYIAANGEPMGRYDYAYSKLLAERSPTVRVMALIRYLDDCSLLHGIFRTDVLRAAWAAYGQLGYIGADHVLLVRAARDGRFIYEPDTHLIRRNPHVEDTKLEQLKRMRGDAQIERGRNVEPPSHRLMQCRQYELAAEVSRGDGIAGALFRLEARYHLVSRFGSFGETKATRALERLLHTRPTRTAMALLDRAHDLAAR